jgi:hypothetical protein
MDRKACLSPLNRKVQIGYGGVKASINAAQLTEVLSP